MIGRGADRNLAKVLLVFPSLHSILAIALAIAGQLSFVRLVGLLVLLTAVQASLAFHYLRSSVSQEDASRPQVDLAASRREGYRALGSQLVESIDRKSTRLNSSH